MKCDRCGKDAIWYFWNNEFQPEPGDGQWVLDGHRAYCNHCFMVMFGEIQSDIQHGNLKEMSQEEAAILQVMEA